METTILGITVVLYAVAAVVSVVAAHRSPASVRRYAYAVAGVVVVSAVGMVLYMFDVGQYAVASGGTSSVPQFIDDSVAYGVLFGMTVFFAGASKRMIGLVVGLSVGSRVAIEVAVIFGGTAVGIGFLASILTYLARVYLLWWPVWRTAQTQPPARQLLYWKSRNLLMLLIGVILLAALIAGVGIFDSFVELVVLEYIDLMIRVGFAGFLLSNIGALDSGGDLPGAEESTAPEVPADSA